MKKNHPSSRLLSYVSLILLAALGSHASEGAAAEKSVLVAVLIDTSGSVNDSALLGTRLLVRQFTQKLPQGSTIAIFRFDDKSELVQGRTSDLGAIDRALASLERRGKHTVLNDALYDASRYLLSQEASTKAILLVTDGKDENSTMELGDGLSLAETSRIPVFTVGVGNVQEKALARIARLTGGEYVSLEEAQGAALAKSIRKAVSSQTPETIAGSASVTTRATTGQPQVSGSTKEKRSWLLVLIVGSFLLTGAVLTALLRRKSVARCGNCGERLPNTNSPCPVCEVEELPELQASSQVPAAPAPGLELQSRPKVNRIDGTLLIHRNAGLLLVKEGVGEGQVFTLDREKPKIIGRNPTVDIYLADPTISQEHCRLTPQRGVYVLHDLGSTNGSFVNGDSIDEHTLRHGDSIRLGDTVLTFLEGISH